MPHCTDLCPTFSFAVSRSLLLLSFCNPFLSCVVCACACFGLGVLQSAAAFLMSFFPGSSGMTIITNEDENAEVSLSHAV